MKIQPMSNAFTYVGLFLVSLVLGGCSFLPQTSQETSKDPQSQLLPTVTIASDFEVGEPAPPFTTQTITGNPFNSSEYYGQTAIVLDFWAGWCQFCLSEMPELEKIHQSLGEEVLVVGIHRTETEFKEVGVGFAQELGATYLLVQDDGRLYQAANGIGMPVAVFIDKDGIVRRIKIGPKTAEQIQAIVGDLVAQ